MKLRDIKGLSSLTDLTKKDVLGAVGLAEQRSTSGHVLEALGLFTAGIVVGAGVALLLAPKSGKGLREDIGQRLRRVKSTNGSTESLPNNSEPVDTAPIA